MLKRLFRRSPSEERQPIVNSEALPPSTSNSSSKSFSKSSSTPLALRIFPSMGWKQQKYFTYGISAAFFLLGGLEYGIVLPSLWQFLNRRFLIGDDGPFLGLTMAAFSATSFVTSPLVGLIIDRVECAKICLLVGASLSVFGNILYFLAINKWFVLWGRVFCGAGWAVRPALLADITRTTSAEQRTGIITLMMVFPQLGYFIGPAINVVLANFNFYIFDSILVDKYTAAGFVSACLFLILFFLAAFFYFDLKRVQELELAEDSELKDIMEGAFVNESFPKKLVDRKEEEDDEDDEMNERDVGGGGDDRKILNCEVKIRRISPTPTPPQQSLDDENKNYSSLDSKDFSADISSSTSTSFPPLPPPEDPSFFSAPLAYLSYYIRDEIIVIMFLVFNSTFASVSIETAAFPLMDFLFGWTILANSMFGSVACGAVIVTYFLLHRLSKTYDDRVILLVLQGIAVFSLLWLMTAYGQGMKYADLFRHVGGDGGISGIKSEDLAGIEGISPEILVIIRESSAWQTLVMIGFFFFFVSVPSISVISISLLSKLLSSERQGLGQGAQQNMVSIANIIGPLWAGALLWTNIYVLFGIEILLFFLVLCMTGGSWKRLKPARE